MHLSQRILLCPRPANTRSKELRPTEQQQSQQAKPRPSSKPPIRLPHNLPHHDAIPSRNRQPLQQSRTTSEPSHLAKE